jgi:mRNA interferase MazF
VKEGDIALTPLQQADGQIKNRPVAVLKEMPPFRDLLVCGISTQLRQEIAGFDEIIQPADSDFAASGLKAPSVIRLGFLAVLPRSSFVGAIGTLSPERRSRLLQKLSDFLRP